MSFSHGKNAYINLDNAAGTPTDISAYVTGVDIKPNAETADVTCLGAAAKSYIAGLTDCTITLSGKWDPTMDAIGFAALGNQKSFVYGPAGSTAGYVKYSGEAFGKSWSPPAKVEGALEWTLELQVSGALGHGTF